MLEYKTKWSDSKLIIAPRYYASAKLCLACHHKEKTLPLSKREWTCHVCQKIYD